MWLALGRVYESIATRAYETLVDRGPESAEALALVAEARLDGGQPEVALALYRKALERAPAMRGLHAAIARLYRQTGHAEWAAVEDERERRQPALDCARTPLECRFVAARHREVLSAGAGSSTPAAAYWVARSSNVLAGEAFAQLEALPASAPLHEWRAAQLRDEGRYAESAAEWRQALGLRPRRRAAPAGARPHAASRPGPGGRRARARRAAAGRARFRRGQLPAGGRAARASAARGGDPPAGAGPCASTRGWHTPRGALGRAYALVGRTQEAIPELEQALRVDEDGSLHLQLARAYQAVGRSADAERTLGAWRSLREAAGPTDTAAAKPALTPP